MIKHKLMHLSTHRVTRFALVGLWNTAFDFILYNILIAAGVAKTLGSRQALVCNLISATIAAFVSFELNQRFVFSGNKKIPPHYRLYFLVIVLSGIFVLQSSIIYGVVHFAQTPLGWAHSFSDWLGLPFSYDFIQNNVAKVLATIVTMVWNYFLFQNFIFKPDTSKIAKK